MKYCIVTPWHSHEQRDKFLEAWNVNKIPNYLILQQDKFKDGCAKTKNAGIVEAIHNSGAEVVIILDDDCYPCSDTFYDYYKLANHYNRDLLEQFSLCYLEALEPKPVKLYEAITDPPSRGTPYFNRTIEMPVAASMGFWNGIPDLDAASQLRNPPVRFIRKTMFWRFFPFSGMNCAFRASLWPTFKFDELCPRFDDIFMGYRFQFGAYQAGYCINLNGPMVRHVRQSNVWENLKIEAQFMERNETEWQQYLYD